MDNFKIILEAMIDQSSLTNAQKQIAKERLKIGADISVEDFAKSKQEIEKQLVDLAKGIKTILGDAISDKQATQWANQYYNEMISGAKKVAREQDRADKERLASIEKIRKASQQSQEQKEVEKQNQIKGILDNQIAAYKEIQSINKQIASLDPQEAAQQISALESKKKIQQEIFLAAQKALGANKSQENNEIRLKAFAEERKKTESEIAVIKGKQADRADKERLTQATSLLSKHKDAWKEILNIRGKIASLDPNENSAEIAELKKQEKAHENILNLTRDQLKAYKDIISEDKRRTSLGEVKADAMSDVAMKTAKRVDADTQKVKEIKIALDTEEFSKDIRNVENKLAKVGKFTLSDKTNADIFEKAQKSATALNATYNQLKTTMADTNATDREKLDIEEKYQQELTTTLNLLSQIKLNKDDEFVEIGDSRRVNMINTLNNYLVKNTAMFQKNKEKILEWIKILESSDDMTVGATKKINTDFKTLDSTLRKTGQLGLSWTDKFKQAWEKFGGWSFATGTLVKLWTGMKKVYEEALNLDTAITDLTMATGASASEIEKLVDSYSNLAEELNATVTDVIESGTEWLKQGQSIADTETLIANAMILSKIAKLSSADATKYLTSVMKGYKVSAEGTLSVVDKLSAVDMASATDVGGLAEGMSEVASSADLAGVSMDKLLGYLATIGEVTQAGMSSVGTTLNAVFTRMGNIKLSRLTDYETGEDLSNVETVLRGVQISLRDTNDSFRDFDEVLDETASRWDSFSETQQRAIASAFAGTRNQNEFIVLMENYGNALKYAEVSANSSGEAMQKFESYQKSVTAHKEQFIKSVQDFANTAIDSGVVNFFIDLGTVGVKALDGLVGFITPLGTLAASIGAIAGIKNFGRPKMYGLKSLF